MSPTFRRVFPFVLTFSLTALAAAQEPPPAPTEEGRDAVRVTVEEVRIPVAAYGEGGRFDPALAAEDLLVREDGAAQQVKGVFRLPAAELLAQAAELADEIDAHYVVTYKPSRPVAAARPGEYRKLDVIARRLRLAVRTRRGYFVKK